MKPRDLSGLRSFTGQTTKIDGWQSVYESEPHLWSLYEPHNSTYVQAHPIRTCRKGVDWLIAEQIKYQYLAFYSDHASEWVIVQRRPLSEAFSYDFDLKSPEVLASFTSAVDAVAKLIAPRKSD